VCVWCGARVCVLCVCVQPLKFYNVGWLKDRPGP